MTSEERARKSDRDRRNYIVDYNRRYNDARSTARARKAKRRERTSRSAERIIYADRYYIREECIEWNYYRRARRNSAKVARYIRANYIYEWADRVYHNENIVELEKWTDENGSDISKSPRYSTVYPPNIEYQAIVHEIRE